MITTTGPKISSCAIRMSFRTPANTVGWMKLPSASSGSSGRVPPVTTVAPSARPMSTYSYTRSHWRVLMSAPICVSQRCGRPIRIRRARSENRATNSSYTGRSTSTREPAEHTSPWAR